MALTYFGWCGRLQNELFALLMSPKGRESVKYISSITCSKGDRVQESYFSLSEEIFSYNILGEKDLQCMVIFFTNKDFILNTYCSLMHITQD